MELDSLDAITIADGEVDLKGVIIKKMFVVRGEDRDNDRIAFENIGWALIF